VGSLNLSHNHIGRPSVEHIAQFLYAFPAPLDSLYSVNSLIVTMSHFTHHITACSHANRSLTSLNLAHNK
jgi:hypothetical protein